MNVSAEEQELVQEVMQYYDKQGDGKIGVDQIGLCLRTLGCVPTEKQLTSFTKQWDSSDLTGIRVSIEEFIPIYGDLKKSQNSAHDHDRMMACLSNFDRDQEGYIQEADLRHMLENLGEKLTSSESDKILHNIDFVNGRARIPDVVDLILGRLH